MSDLSCLLLTAFFSTLKSKFLTIFQLEAKKQLASKCEWAIEREREHVWRELSSVDYIVLNS